MVLTNLVEAYGDSPDDVEPYYNNNVSPAAVTVREHMLYLPLLFRQYP
jgi:hypothetical protein